MNFPNRHRIAGTVVVLALMLVAAPGFSQDDEEERAKYQPYRDYGTDWRLSSLFGYTPEDGLLLGTGAIVYKFGFRTFPYVYRMELVGGITLPTGRLKFIYTAGFPALGNRVGLDLLAYASELEVRNFYGYGNATQRDEKLEDNDYYRVASRQYFVKPALKYRLGAVASLHLGASYKYFSIREQADRFISTIKIDSLGNSRSVAGFGLDIVLVDADEPVAPRNGFFVDIGAWNYPGLRKDERPFQRYHGDVRGYASAGPATLALRVAAEKLHGNYPFYESAFLGGPGTLRGYNLNRFSGDASLVGSSEVRLDLFTLKLLVPSRVGMFVFGEAGRVYVEGRSPGGWHADVGGGVSLAPISRDMTLSLSVATSNEGVFVSGGFGYSF